MAPFPERSRECVVHRRVSLESPTVWQLKPNRCHVPSVRDVISFPLVFRAAHHRARLIMCFVLGMRHHANRLDFRVIRTWHRPLKAAAVIIGPCLTSCFGGCLTLKKLYKSGNAPFRKCWCRSTLETPNTGSRNGAVNPACPSGYGAVEHYRYMYRCIFICIYTHIYMYI